MRIKNVKRPYIWSEIKGQGFSSIDWKIRDGKSLQIWEEYCNENLVDWSELNEALFCMLEAQDKVDWGFLISM